MRLREGEAVMAAVLGDGGGDDCNRERGIWVRVPN